MKDKQIRVIVKTVDGDWEIKTIDNTLKALQQIVGGYIEVASIYPWLVVVCDEEGIVKGKPINVILNRPIFGDFLIAKTQEDEFVSLTYGEAINVIKNMRWQAI